MRRVAAGIIIVLGLGACSGEPSDRIAVPGAPPGGDTRPPASAISTTTTSPATTASTTSSVPSQLDATTTTIVTASTGPGVTTSATTTALPTTLAPTTTVLVYAPEPADGPLRIGFEGPRSLQIQQQLIALAILPSTAADSKYGPGTAAGVRRFQESQGLVVDGVAGPNTVDALTAAVAAQTPSTTTT